MSPLYRPKALNFYLMINNPTGYRKKKGERDEIAVIGAGIAGTSCAHELHKLGHEVEIFEMSNREKSIRPRQMDS